MAVDYNRADLTYLVGRSFETPADIARNVIERRKLGSLEDTGLLNDVIDDIVAANPGLDRNAIVSDTTLAIPPTLTRSPPAPTNPTPQPPSFEARSVNARHGYGMRPIAASVTPSRAASNELRSVPVGSETVRGLAAKYGITVDALRKADVYGRLEGVADDQMPRLPSYAYLHLRLPAGLNEKASPLVSTARRYPTYGSYTMADAAAYLKTRSGLGLTDEQIAGIVGNLWHESRGRIHALGRAGDFGIAQWTGSRKRALIRRYGPRPTFEEQMSFLVQELNSYESRALYAVRGATSVDAATRVFCRLFERPGRVAMGARLMYARTALQSKRLRSAAMI